jgi:chromosome segregation ATPase
MSHINGGNEIHCRFQLKASDDMGDEMEKTKAELEKTKAELEKTKAELEKAKAELEKTNVELVTQRRDLHHTKLTIFALNDHMRELLGRTQDIEYQRDRARAQVRASRMNITNLQRIVNDLLSEKNRLISEIHSESEEAKRQRDDPH